MGWIISCLNILFTTIDRVLLKIRDQKKIKFKNPEFLNDQNLKLIKKSFNNKFNNIR